MSRTRTVTFASLTLAFALSLVAGCSSSKKTPDETANVTTADTTPVATTAEAPVNTDNLNLGASSAGRAL